MDPPLDVTLQSLLLICHLNLNPQISCVHGVQNPLSNSRTLTQNPHITTEHKVPSALVVSVYHQGNLRGSNTQLTQSLIGYILALLLWVTPLITGTLSNLCQGTWTTNNLLKHLCQFISPSLQATGTFSNRGMAMQMPNNLNRDTERLVHLCMCWAVPVTTLLNSYRPNMSMPYICLHHKDWHNRLCLVTLMASLLLLVPQKICLLIFVKLPSLHHPTDKVNHLHL